MEAYQLHASIKIHEREENYTIRYQTLTDTMLPVELGVCFLHSVILLICTHLFKYYDNEYIKQEDVQLCTYAIVTRCSNLI